MFYFQTRSGTRGSGKFGRNEENGGDSSQRWCPGQGGFTYMDDEQTSATDDRV